MSEKTLESQIFALLDQLRSELSNRDICVVLATLIYLRWVDFQDAEQEAMVTSKEVAYEPVLPAVLHWRSWYALPPEKLQNLFVAQLSPMLEQLDISRHNSFSSHLCKIAPVVKNLGRVSPSALEVLIQWLAEQPFETLSDRRNLLFVYDSLLNKVNDVSFGVFRTPAAIASLLVQLAAPSPGAHVYDPCFGTAGLLTACYDHVLYDNPERGGLVSSWKDDNFKVSGIEVNADIFVIGLARLTLAGVDKLQLEMCNSLECLPLDNPQQDGFDIVLANPPWGKRLHPMNLEHYPVPTTDATGLFIQHVLFQLRPKGRAVIVVPQSFLFRGGLEKKLRRILIEQHTLEAVVELPQKAFLPYTAVQASILVFRRGGSTELVRMIDARKILDKRSKKLLTVAAPLIGGVIGGVLFGPLLSKVTEALMNKQVSMNRNRNMNSWDVSAQSLADVDWDLTPKHRNRSDLSNILDSLRSEVDVRLLKECCTILSGQSIPKDQLMDEPPFRTISTEKDQAILVGVDQKQKELLLDAQVIPYVRIKDVKHGYASKGSSWISSNAAESVNPKRKLKVGDMLLSKSGTIGKVGLVRNEAVGAIATSGLFVLRPDQNLLDPHFLLAYLDSSECRTWLDDRARGATIQHLSKRVLCEMYIPLPSLQIQQHVAKQHIEYGFDVLNLLNQLLIHGEEDLITEWVDKAILALPNDIDLVDNPLDLNPLNHIAENIQKIRNQVAHGNSGDSELAEWFLSFSEVISGLQGITAIPQGPGLLSVFQETIQAFKATESLIEGHLLSEAKARDLTNLLSTWLEKASSALLDNVKLIVSTNIVTVPVEGITVIPLSIHNKGLLPLRNLNISTTPDWGFGETAYLAENAIMTFNLSKKVIKTTGTINLLVKWTAKTLDGQPIDGTREISFEAVDAILDPDRNEFNLGGSPYVCGDPVGPDRSNVFFGREELLKQIRRQIIRSGNVVLLEGNRRSGKSSILLHLKGENAIPGWFGVYCNLQGADGSMDGVGVPTTQVFRKMAYDIAMSLQIHGYKTPLPDGTVLPPDTKIGITDACMKGIGETSSFLNFQDYIEVVLETLAKHDLGLLFMLDEFDKLQEGIDRGVTSPQVPENIRFLIHNYTRFSAILTGSRRLKRLREEYWSALFGLGTRLGVTSLPAEEARLLVTEPVKGKLTYSPEAIKQAIFLTSGQPYLLQCLCNRVFDMSTQLKTRSVTFDLVDQAANALVVDNGHFADLWKYTQSDRRRFILALCQKEFDSPDLLQLGVIQERLFNHGIEISDETLIADIEFLRELELIKLVGESSEGHYVLAIPLMGIWIGKQHDFAAIKSRAKSETEDQNE